MPRPSTGSRRATAKPGRDTRERILRAALDVFAERGFEGARTRDIADASGANLGLLQYYFGGKEKLWRAAVDHAFGELWTALEAAGPAASGGGADHAEMARLVGAAVRFAAEHPALIRLMNDEGKRDGPRLRWLVDRHGRRLLETATALLHRAQAVGLLAGVEPIHFYYLFVGAAGLLFSQAAECKRLTGVDPTASPAMVQAHAEALARLLVGT